jgi:phosphate starvation-inducible PhoH-like protein
MSKRKRSSEIGDSSILSGAGHSKVLVVAKNDEQKELLKSVRDHIITFATGPAGTGKTYLSVAQGLQYLYKQVYKQIVFTRPVIEAGENLGFLPGDVMEKIEPYMMPIFHTLHKLISPDELEQLLRASKDKPAPIQIVPFAFMRGLSFDDSFCVVDEAQNTTPAQMRMLLTRIGERSKMVICGDLDQSDLGPRNGLWEATNALTQIEEIGFINLTEAAIVRHPIIQKIEMEYRRYRFRDSKPETRGVPYWDPDAPPLE